MKYVWQDLDKPMNAFTVRSATMRNLNTGKIVQHYSANTKIVLVQKCVTEIGTFYRTREAAHHYLNYAFEASAFGLPNEIAPSAPSTSFLNNSKLATRTPKPARRQTLAQNKVSPKGGGENQKKNWIHRIFRRKNG